MMESARRVWLIRTFRRLTSEEGSSSLVVINFAGVDAPLERSLVNPTFFPERGLHRLKSVRGAWFRQGGTVAVRCWILLVFEG